MGRAPVPTDEGELIGNLLYRHILSRYLDAEDGTDYLSRYWNWRRTDSDNIRDYKYETCYYMNFNTTLEAGDIMSFEVQDGSLGVGMSAGDSFNVLTTVPADMDTLSDGNRPKLETEVTAEDNDPSNDLVRRLDNQDNSETDDLELLSE